MLKKQNTKNKKQNNEENKNYVVAGYTFKSKQASQDAKDELNAINYMTKKANQNDPAQIYMLYNKILDRELFKTQVGINYLKELQQYLYIHKAIPNDKIRPIPINQDVQAILDKKRETAKNRDELLDLSRKVKHNKDLFIKSMILNVMLLIAIVAMVVITMFSSQANIINYEINLQNKYASWQEELESKEDVIRQKEEVLEKQTSGVDNSKTNINNTTTNTTISNEKGTK